MLKTLNSLACAAMAMYSASVLAHGDDKHAQHPQFDRNKVEVTEFGQAGDPKKASRSIKVDMADSMRFTPATISIRLGQTVRFTIRNDGKQLHEMVLGTPEALKEHAELMKRFPEMEHSDPNMAHVKPGAAGQIIWKFTKAGEFQFACLQPGHYEAGMVGRLVVK
jgi:hypothetical protein